MNTDAIQEFTGEYFFLSNYYDPCVVHYAGYKFRNSEAAYQAAKCPRHMWMFQMLSPDASKWLARKLTIRSDWEKVKTNIMYDVCWAKFTQHPELRDKLLATGTRELIEGNTWGDRVWGTVDGVGENRLGKILMKIRDKLANENFNK